MSLFDIFNKEKQKVSKLSDKEALALAKELGVPKPESLKRGQLNTAINAVVKAKKDAAKKAVAKDTIAPKKDAKPAPAAFKKRVHDAVMATPRNETVLAYIVASQKKDVTDAELFKLAEAAIRSSRTQAGVEVLTELVKANS